MARRGWIVALVAAAALAACGDDAADPDEDEELIEAALPTLDDLPEGFEAEPPDDEDEDNPCSESVLGIDQDEIDDAQTAATDRVHFHSDKIDVYAEITAFEDDDIPRRIFAGADDDDYLDCVEDEFNADPSDATIEGIDIEELPVDNDEVDDGFTVALTIDVGGTAVASRSYFALVDRYAVDLDVVARPDDFDEGLATDLLAGMLDRVKD